MFSSAQLTWNLNQETSFNPNQNVTFSLVNLKSQSIIIIINFHTQLYLWLLYGQFVYVRIESEATFWPKFHSLLFLQYWGLMQATRLFGFWPKTFSIIRISCLDEVVRLRHIDYVMLLKLTRVRNKDIKYRRESRSV